MGKKNKDKKTGKGSEKTLAKTEKKNYNKMKKELQSLGEDEIENIVAQIEKEEKNRSQVIEAVVDLPSRRLNFSFVAHPEKEQLILYGGEFFNGKKTSVYNDLFFYNISNNTWTVVKAPAAPPPRCGHQMVVTAANQGQLWIFGGEFASATQSQFYHYRDLWVYHIARKRWEKITAANGPTARSGHRMVFLKKQLIIFGGFHDNLRDYKYFNDIYSFDTETYKWTKLEPTGTAPAPRSGCCMIALTDGKVLIYGGYSKQKLKKDMDKGHVYTDAFLLIPEKDKASGIKFKWVQIKIGGNRFSPRCSMSIATAPNNLSAFCYGGVFDIEDDEDNITGNFFNDFYQLDLENLVWKKIILTGKRDTKYKRNTKCIEDDKSDTAKDMHIETLQEKVDSITILDDGVFKVTVGSTSTLGNITMGCNTEQAINIFHPSPRMNCGLAIKHNILFLYGGMFEEGDKQITFNDFYALDLKKIDEWKILNADDMTTVEWLDSESEETGSEEYDDICESEMTTDKCLK